MARDQKADVDGFGQSTFHWIASNMANSLGRMAWHKTTPKVCDVDGEKNCAGGRHEGNQSA
jgi:hypothetical protein